jgi:hypothetical protein
VDVLYLAWTLRLSVAFVLIAAAAGKLRAGRLARGELALAVRRLGAPVRLASLAAPAVLVAECGIAVLACLPGTALLGCLAATVLFGAFSAGVARLVAIGARASCRCFGPASDLGGRHVVRNLALVAQAGGAALVTALAPQGGTPPSVLAVAIAPAVLVAAAFVRWDDLVILVAGLPEPASNQKGKSHDRSVVGSRDGRTIDLTRLARPERLGNRPVPPTARADHRWV